MGAESMRRLRVRSMAGSAAAPGEHNLNGGVRRCDTSAVFETVFLSLFFSFASYWALLHPQARARALRRARDFEAASADLREALRLAPRFAAGLLDQGILHMDHGLPADALQSFETLLHLNREYPGLDNWIVRASAEVNREDLALAMEAERAGSAGDKLPPGGANDEQSDDEASDSLRHLTLQHNHYTVLGLCHDFDAGELRKAFRRAGRIYHPDKVLMHG